MPPPSMMSVKPPVDPRTKGLAVLLKVSELMSHLASMSGVRRRAPPKTTLAAPLLTGAVLSGTPVQLTPLLQRLLMPPPSQVWARAAAAMSTQASAVKARSDERRPMATPPRQRLERQPVDVAGNRNY